MRFLRSRNLLRFSSLKVAMTVIGCDFESDRPVFTSRMSEAFDIISKIPANEFVDLVRFVAFQSAINDLDNDPGEQYAMFWDGVQEYVECDELEDLKNLLDDSNVSNEIPKLVFEAMVSHGFTERYSLKERSALKFLNLLYERYKLSFEDVYMEYFETIDILDTEEFLKNNILAVREGYIPKPILVAERRGINASEEGIRCEGADS